MSETRTVSVTILDREYQISCPDNEVDALLKAVDYLNGKMREIRDKSVIGLDRIAVMAALNITHELLDARSAQDREQSLQQDQQERLQQLSVRIDDVLVPHGKDDS